MTKLKLLLPLLFLLISCSSDDNEDGQSTTPTLIGLWQIQSATYNGEPINDTETVFFMNDNTVRFEYADSDFGIASWTRNDSQLVFDFQEDPEPYVYEIIELTNNNLSWKLVRDGNTLIESFVK